MSGQIRGGDDFALSVVARIIVHNRTAGDIESRERLIGFLIRELMDKLKQGTPSWGSAVYLYHCRYKQYCGALLTGFNHLVYAQEILDRHELTRECDVIQALKDLSDRYDTDGQPEWQSGHTPSRLDAVMARLLKGDLIYAAVHRQLYELMLLILVAEVEPECLATAYPQLMG